MLYFQMFVIAIGLFVLSDPFKAVTIEEETASGAWQVMPSLTVKPKTNPLQEPTILQETKEAKPQQSSANSTLKEAALQSALEEFKLEALVEAVKNTHTARLEETRHRDEARKNAGITATTLDNIFDVDIPSVKKGFTFVFSEILPRAFNVVIKTALVWMPMVLALL